MSGKVISLDRVNNDELWNWYINYKIPLAINKNIRLGKTAEKAVIDAKISVNQYKTHLRNLENEIQNDFEKITVEQIQNVNPKSKSFINGFFIDCIVHKKMKPNTDVILYLIPEEYRRLVQIIMK